MVVINNSTAIPIPAVTTPGDYHLPADYVSLASLFTQDSDPDNTTGIVVSAGSFVVPSNGIYAGEVWGCCYFFDG
jgi:hypothetical protein